MGGKPLTCCSSTDVLLRIQGMEDWPFVDDRDLISFRGMQSCATCHHFGYVALSQCQVLGGCHLKQGLLAPGAHALKRCKHWSYATPWAKKVTPLSQ